MTTYSEGYAKELLAALTTLTGDAFCDFSSEIQDAGDFLLITVSPRKSLTENDLSKIEKNIKKYLDERIPKREGDYAWMLAIMEEGVVVGTILPDIGKGDEGIYL